MRGDEGLRLLRRRVLQIRVELRKKGGIWSLARKWRDWRWMKSRRLCGVDLDYVACSELGLSDSDHGHHSATPGPDLEQILAQLGISGADSIIDVGCGKAGALITIAQFPFGRIHGIEFSPELLQIAQKNLCRLNIKNVTLCRADATDYEEYDECNYIYLYNPFWGEVFDKFMHKVRESLVRRPRRLTMLYRNPRRHSAVVLDGIFQKVKELRCGPHPLFIYVHDPNRS